jgi:hypothetical protein
MRDNNAVEGYATGLDRPLGVAGAKDTPALARNLAMRSFSRLRYRATDEFVSGTAPNRIQR